MEANSRFQKQKNKLKLLMELYPVDYGYRTSCELWKEYEYWRMMNKNTNIVEESLIKSKVIVKKEKGNSKNNRESEKKAPSTLLGDLKMFAKNFKMP